MNAWYLLAVGLLCILLEFYIPGTVFVTIGIALLLGSIAVFALASTSGVEAFLFFVVVLLGVGAIVRLAIWRIKSTREKNTLFLSKDQAGYVASSYEAALIGKKGVASSDLKPSGNILVEGNQYQALAQTGYIVKGCEVEVISGQGAYYFVKLCKKELNP